MNQASYEVGYLTLAFVAVLGVLWLYDWQQGRKRKRENRRKVIELMEQEDRAMRDSTPNALSRRVFDQRDTPQRRQERL